MDRKPQVTVGQAAWRGMKAHPGEIARTAAEQVLLRLAVLCPLAARAALGERVAVPGWLCLCLSLLLYGFLVIPLRFRAGETFRYCSGPHQARPRGGRAYANWLKTGLTRYGRGLLWGLPFLMIAGYFIYGWSNLPFNTMWMPVLALTLPGSAALMLLAVFLFVFGWWRDLPAEYIPARHLGARKTFFFVRRARKMGRGRMIRNALANVLLCLPSILGFAAVLAPHIRRGLPASSNVQLVIGGLLKLLRTPLTGGQQAALLAVFALLYLPLCLLRKMRNAVLTRRLTREISDLEDPHADR